MSYSIIHHNSNLTPVSNLMISATNRFLIETKRDKAETTYNTYKAKIKVFNSFIESFSMSQDMRADLKAFRSWLTDRYTSASTINLTLSVVRQFYRSLHERGVIEYDPTVVLKNVTDTDSVKRSAISREQFYQIATALREDRSINAPRNRALFLLLCMNGLRVSEASTANIEDIEIDRGRRVLFLKRKGYEEKSNYVILQDKTYEVLRDLIGERKAGAIFISYRTKEAMTGNDLSRIIKTVFRKCNIDSKKITAHSLRHSYAIFALEGKADLLSVSHSMNHKNLSTTQRYLRSYNRMVNSAEDAVSLDF